MGMGTFLPPPPLPIKQLSPRDTCRIGLNISLSYQRILNIQPIKSQCSYYKEASKLICISNQLTGFRSCPPDIFYAKTVLKNCANFAGKHLCQILFLNKVQGLSV